MSDAAPRAPHRLPVDWSAFDAVLFDLDGVLTPTAEVHQRAWKEMFDEFLSRHAPGLADGGADDPARPFDDDDYLRYVDGKPRFDGVRAFLASRGISLPEGDVGDAPTALTVCGLGNRKNELFGQVLGRDGMHPFPGSVRVLDHLDRLGVQVAVVSSSRNTPSVLRAAGLAERFEVVVDGNVAAARHIAGKPAPDMYLEAARELGAAPRRAVVVEDAISGVEAGRAGGFALVLGVDRGAGVEALRAHGADLVVDDLARTLDPADPATDPDAPSSRSDPSPSREPPT
jgi:beta-phosphoglucomutase family hydrolase